MKVNSNHHLPNLSGLSQAPLIGNDNASERSTPISAHSLSQQSPRRITPLQHMPQPQQQQLQQQPLSSTSQPRNSTCSFQVPGSSIFFPPLPPRLAKKSLMTLDINGSGNNVNGGDDNSPKIADLNMNAEGEQNRESFRQQPLATSQMSANSLNQHMRHPSSGSSKLNSPLSVPAKHFPGFFPESHQVFAQQQQQAKRIINQTSTTPLSASTATIINNSNANNWSQQQEDNYHLYHEPIDTDEQGDLSWLQKNSNNSPLDKSLAQAPPPPHPRVLNASSPKAGNQWPIALPTSSSKKSPPVVHNEQSLQLISSPFAERSSSFRNDVSADIYFCYVTRKSIERANHRSRSYHGPKNTSTSAQGCGPQSSPLFMGTTKNLSSSSVAETPVSPTISGHSMMPFQFRDHCVRELIETESNYVHALEIIITCFAKPLELLLKKEDNQLIFGHIRYFHHIHSAFQADLLKAAFKLYNKDLPKIPSPTGTSSVNRANPHQANSNPTTPTSLSNNSPVSSPTIHDATISPQVGGGLSNKNVNSLKISSCFLNAKEKFLKYGEYCATLSKAQALLDELTSRNEAIAAQLDRCQQEANEGKFKLRDLLSLPMQRILKYHLLLAQLIKNTSSTNEDYHGLKRAHETMVDLGQYINEVKRDTEAVQIINDIEQTIIGLNMPSNTQLTDYGRLVTDGFIRIRVPQDSRPKQSHESKLKLPHDPKIKQKRYVFVFDKVMLMCKVSGVRGYQYKEALVLSEYDLDKNPLVAPSETLSKHAMKDKWSYHFNLVRNSDRTVYSFYSKSQEMKTKWIDAIQRAMDNTRPAACRNNETNHEFLMHTFDRASSCDHCGKLLMGLYYQGYRCRICFMSAHKKCLSLIKPCGPTLPPRRGDSNPSRVGRCNEPTSPSVRSNCSDDDRHFMHFPPSNSSSTQCMDAILKNEYSNLRGKIEPVSSSFRGNGSNVGQRPVSSMINVSLQNSTNHLLQQRRLLRGSTSTPAISRKASLRAKVIADYDGDEDAGELKMMTGDLILISHGTIQRLNGDDEIEVSISKLTINSCLFGRNTRTGREGRFPRVQVELVHDLNGSENLLQDTFVQENIVEPINSYVNFILDDHPWFSGRMDRDQAQALLEKMPHGTFLVRVSPKHNGSYVISLNHNGQVKHMRIYVSKDNQLYLSQNRYFKSVIELVSWYEKNSLVESFHMLDGCLSIPFKSC